MTEAEFLALPPEEQAGIVAEKAMGYTWWLAPSGCRYLVAPENTKHVAKYARKTDGTEPICRDYLRDVPNFATDVVAMWALMERLASGSYYLDITNWLGEDDRTEWGVTVGHSGYRHSSAPLALCVATLMMFKAIT